jgi:hypothetical protein
MTQSSELISVSVSELPVVDLLSLKAPPDTSAKVNDGQIRIMHTDLGDAMGDVCS